jgi:hypothetical protein
MALIWVQRLKEEVLLVERVLLVFELGLSEFVI